MEKREYSCGKNRQRLIFFLNSQPKEKTNVYLSTLTLKSEVFLGGKNMPFNFGVSPDVKDR